MTFSCNRGMGRYFIRKNQRGAAMTFLCGDCLDSKADEERAFLCRECAEKLKEENGRLKGENDILRSTIRLINKSFKELCEKHAELEAERDREKDEAHKRQQRIDDLLAEVRG